MIKWIIQNNLIKKETLDEFRTAFKELSVKYEEVQVIPFSPALPRFNPADPTMTEWRYVSMIQERLPLTPCFLPSLLLR